MISNRVALPRLATRTAGYLAVIVLTACHEAAPPANSAPPYKLSASVGEIMEAMVDPAADRVWDSVGVTLTPKAVDSRRPHTDAEWRDVRNGVITLLEATNLLMMPGRKMVPPNGKMLDEGSDGVLTAVAAQQRLETQSAVFVQFASALHEVAEKLLKAADARDADALFEIGGEMDAICEGCHTTFWYPNQAVYRPEKVDAGK